MSADKYNAEGYYDPTAYGAFVNIEAEKRQARFRPIVYICSPYSGDTETNVENARRYSRFAVDSGFLPIAPHLPPYPMRFSAEHPFQSPEAYSCVKVRLHG